MLAGLLARRGLARAALAGLALGFGTLAALSLWGAVSGQRAAADLRVADQTRTAWDQALVQVSTENEALFDYVRAPDELAIEPIASQLGSAGATLTWLERHHSAANARQIDLVSGTYATFTLSLRGVVTAARGGYQEQALAKAGEASLSAASLRKQLYTAIEFERIRLAATVDKAGRNADRLRGATLAALGIDLVQLSLCAMLLLGYQRRIEGHARRSSHLAMHDRLTGLPNRGLFDERLDRAVAGAASTERLVALLMVDLNDFKNINDTLGHHHGDLLLKIVAQRLGNTVRAADSVARLGGDEFAALLTEIGSLAQAEALAWRILAAIREPAELDGVVVEVGASIGISMCPNHGDEARLLLRHADAAMYVAKRGQLGVVVYAAPAADAPAADAPAADAPAPAEGGPHLPALGPAMQPAEHG